MITLPSSSRRAAPPSRLGSWFITTPKAVSEVVIIRMSYKNSFMAYTGMLLTWMVLKSQFLVLVNRKR